MTTSELKVAWTDAGRGSKVDNALTSLIKSGKVTRTPVKDGQGSIYALTGKAPKGAGKPKTAKPVSTKAAGKPTVRKAFDVTAEQFILGLLKAKPLTTKQVNAAWSKAGRGGVADSDLSRMTKLGKIKRQPLGGKLGSQYSVA